MLRLIMSVLNSFFYFEIKFNPLFWLCFNRFCLPQIKKLKPIINTSKLDILFASLADTNKQKETVMKYYSNRKEVKCMY